MDDEVVIIVPSRGRAESVHTKIDGMVILVDENEKSEYEKYNKDYAIHTHPSLKSLSAIRQFAYDKYKNLFMVDDDVVSVERLYTTKNAILTETEISEIIQKAYRQAKDIGAKLFGFNNNPCPTHYNQHKPFVLSGYINGCAIGLLESDNLYFHQDTVACESHWITLLNSHYNRFSFIDKRYHFRQKAGSTFALKGGQVGRRTLETEKQDTLLLKRYFGDSIQIKKEVNKTKQLHEYQRQLNLRL